MSSDSSFEIINVAILDPKLYFWIASSVAGAADVNPHGNKTLSARGVSKLFINGKPAFGNGLNLIYYLI